jgi:dTMP kinase
VSTGTDNAAERQIQKAWGKYVVIEGHDGTGKSTQVGLIRERLKQQGIESVEFHEPQGVPISDAIRTIIKNGTLDRDGITNLLLFSAARHELWRQSALPALKRGDWVIASRNYYSTLAYQGYGEGMDQEVIELVTLTATDETYMRPDVSFILSLEDEPERKKRIAARGELDNPDTFESRGDEFQLMVQQAYKKVAEEHNIPVIDASQSIEEVTETIWKEIQPEIRSNVT